jgi:hypothetical protein
MAAEE